MKKLEDKINEGQEQISFIHKYLNLVFFNLFSTTAGETSESNVYKNLLPLFFYLSEINFIFQLLYFTEI